MKVAIMRYVIIECAREFLCTNSCAPTTPTPHVDNLSAINVSSTNARLAG